MPVESCQNRPSPPEVASFREQDKDRALAIVSPFGGNRDGHGDKINSGIEEGAVNGREQYKKKLVREIRQMFSVNGNVGEQDTISEAKYSKLSLRM